MSFLKAKQSKAKLQETSPEETSRKIQYFSHQLDLAHKRNDLVDHLRFNILQIFFGFETFLIGAVVLKGSDISNLLGGWEILLPLFAFLIGFSLYVMFFRYHIYLYGYKKWIENLESSLTKLVFSLEENGNLNGYTGTYSLTRDKVFNMPKIKLEGVVSSSLLLMATLNVGVSFLLFRLFNLAFDKCLYFLLLGFMSHIVITFLLRIRNSRIR